MPTIVFLDADGTRREVDAAIGETVMRAALDGGVTGIMADCGGTLSCATCHVYIPEQAADIFDPISPYERDMLDGAVDVRPTSRLSCQLRVTPGAAGIVIEVPQSQY